MCSISGFIVTDNSAYRAAIARRLAGILARGQERGSDSVGVLSLDGEGSPLREVRIASHDYGFVEAVLSPDCTVAIANNRAEPTTEFVPEKTGEDVQPFGDETVFISHNGVIANDKELRTEFAIRTRTTIDSSVLPALIHRLGVATALGRIQGSYALAIVDRRAPRRLWLACNYKPLYLQADPELGAIFFASRGEHLSPATEIQEKLVRPAVVQLPPYHLAEIDGETGEIHLQDLSPRIHNHRALVICSGGLDSTTAACWTQLQGYEVTLLHFLYGCRAQEREVAAIRAIAAAMKCDYRLENLNWLGQLGGSPLTDPSLPIAPGETGAEYAHEWVPARNLVFMAMAAALCDRFGYDTLVLGLNLEEGGAYPDNTVEFYEAIDHVCDIGTMSRPRILSPLGNLVKHQIARLALDIDAPVHLSWSCYNGGEYHCGRCGPCYMRGTAFHMIGAEDPVRYETD